MFELVELRSHDELRILVGQQLVVRLVIGERILFVGLVFGLELRRVHHHVGHVLLNRLK